MKTHFLALAALFFAPLLALAADKPAAPEPYKVGDTLAPFTVNDQHEKPFTFAPGPKILLVSYVMSVGKDTNTYLAKQPATFLDDHSAIYMANIYGMPGVGRFFALPKMKKYPHRILLADDEHLLDKHPIKKDHVTLFRLDPTGKITAIEHLDPEKDLPAAFAK